MIASSRLCLLVAILLFVLPVSSLAASLRHEGRRLHLRHRGINASDTVVKDSSAGDDVARAAAAAVAAAEAEDSGKQDVSTELVADKSVKTLSLKLQDLPPQVARIDKVMKDGWADKHGIVPGSIIEEINGQEATTMSSKDFMQNMKARPLKLVVKSPGKPEKMEEMKNTEKSEVTDVPGTAQAAPSVPEKSPGGIDAIAVDQAIKQAIGHAVKISTEASEATAKRLVCELRTALGVDSSGCGGAGAQKSGGTHSVVSTATSASNASAAGSSSAPAPSTAPNVPSAPASAAGQPVIAELKASAITILPVKAGGPVLQVDNQAGFVVGAKVVIDAGTPREETNAIAMKLEPSGSLVMKHPMKFDHLAGTKVTTAEDTLAPTARHGGPPPPMPPSPLDALRAAMAVRSNMTVGLGPGTLLPPQVLDHVAELARGRLGAFKPGSPAPAPCATAPAPAAIAVAIEKVEVSMTVKNVSFTALSQDPSLMAEFEQNAKKSVVEGCGGEVKEEDVEVTLRAGSVIIDSKITPPQALGSNGTGAGDIAKSLMGSASLSTRLIARVKAMPGIKTVALGELSVTPPIVAVVKEMPPTPPVMTTTPPPTRRLPKPPQCTEAPAAVSKGDVALALAPFKPPGARGEGVKTKDGGHAWPLNDGGWAFQYDDMALRMAEDGSTRIVWKKPAYAVEYDESGISYHVGRNVVHRDANGDVTYQQPTGTMHQEGSTLIYHWCSPNVIVYQTPAGFIYYDDMGMTYRSFGKEVTHYTWTGEVLYQGAGGVTRQETDGAVTHWTDAGAIFRHADGSVSYTPTGARKSDVLATGELGLDPFPGPALTTEDVMKLSIPDAMSITPVAKAKTVAAAK